MQKGMFQTVNVKTNWVIVKPLYHKGYDYALIHTLHKTKITSEDHSKCQKIIDVYLFFISQINWRKQNWEQHMSSQSQLYKENQLQIPLMIIIMNLFGCWRLSLGSLQLCTGHYNHGRNLVVDTGNVSPHFWRWGDIICHVPPTFSLKVLYLERFQK